MTAVNVGKVLTVRQAWCWAMTVEDGKPVENRAPSWVGQRYRGWVWFHAAASWDARLRGCIGLSTGPPESVASAPGSALCWRAEWLAGAPAGPGWPPHLEVASGAALADLVRRTTGPALRPINVERAIIGGGNLVDVHGASPACVDGGCWPWGELRYHWSGDGQGRPAHLVFEDRIAIWPPIECVGRLGLWTPPLDLVSALTSALHQAKGAAL